jgi:hypothetical protein
MPSASVSDAAAILGRIGAESPLLAIPKISALERMLDEQSVEKPDGSRIAGPGKSVDASSMQNPCFPELAYRRKDGERHVGVVMNAVEAVNAVARESVVPTSQLFEYI